MSRTITIKAITNARVYGRNPAHGDDAGGVCSLRPERITSEAHRGTSHAHTGSKAHTQTRPVTNAQFKARERERCKADLHILFISSIREARARVITHSRTTNVN
jgi:hypothetical protein